MRSLLPLMFLATFLTSGLHAAPESCDFGLSQTELEVIAKGGIQLSTKRSEVPIVDRGFLSEALEFLYSEGCTSVVLQASQFRKMLQPHVLIKLMGSRGDESLVTTFAFKALKFFPDGTLTELFNAYSPAGRSDFVGTATVMSRDSADTMTVGLLRVEGQLPASAERKEYLAQQMARLRR